MFVAHRANELLECGRLLVGGKFLDLGEFIVAELRGGVGLGLGSGRGFRLGCFQGRRGVALGGLWLGGGLGGFTGGRFRLGRFRLGRGGRPFGYQRGPRRIGRGSGR